jgi:hypothetical protein
MSRMLLGGPNYAVQSGLFTPTLNGGSWLASLPLTNLQDRRMAKVARSSDVTNRSTRLRIDLKTSRLVSFIAIPKHSVSQAGKIRALGVPPVSAGTLFSYEAGDDILALGGFFSRADATTCATYVDSGGRVRLAAANVPRDGHFIGGVRHYLSEPGSTNIVSPSSNFSAAGWVPIGTPTRSAAAAACGVVNLDLIGDDDGAVLEGYREDLAFTGDAVKALALFFRQDTSTSSVIRIRDTSVGADRLLAAITWSGTTPVITMTTGTLIGVESGYFDANGNAVYRALFQTTSVTAAVVNQLQVYPATDAALAVGSTGRIYMGGVMAEDRPFSTSHIITTAGAVTRATDDLYGLYGGGNPTDAGVTLYAKVARPTWYNITPGGNDLFFCSVGSPAACLSLYRSAATAPATALRGRVDTVGTDPESSTAIPSTATFEMIAQYKEFSTGPKVAVDSGSGLTAFSAAASSPLTTIGDTTVYIGQNGSELNPFCGAIQSIRVATGLKTIAEMAALVYDTGWVSAWPAVYPSGSLYSTDPRLVDGKYTAEEAVGYPMTFVAIPSSPFLMQYQSIQIDDSTNVAGFVDLPLLYVGFAYQPTINMSYGVQHGWEDDTVRTVTDGGAAIFNVKSRRRTVRGVLQDEPDDEAFANIWELQRRRGISEQLFYIFDPADTYHLARRSMLCTLRQLSPLELAVGTRDGWPFELVEEL